MTKEQAEIKARAVAYEIAAALGPGMAQAVMKDAIRELEARQWAGSENR